jgi:hypothetical protein
MGRALKYSSIIYILAAAIAAPATRAQTPPPRIFFTDLPSGPNTGGENNNGTILTIYGKNFGATQGSSTVTVGGGAVAAYLQWGVPAVGEVGTQEISVAIGPNAATGSVVVTVGGAASNGVPFTVRPGNIHCVSTSGNDSNSGAFPSSCWATMPHAVSTMAAGDITYVENGVSQTSGNGDNAAVTLSGKGGSSGSPIALVTYPGASVAVGTSSVYRGFYVNSGSGVTQWVLEGFTVVADSEAFNINDGTYMWVIGNDISCPHGASDTACILGDSSGSSNLHFLGNYIHNVGNGGCSGDCHTYQALYVSTNGHSWEAGWNTIVPDPSHTGTAGCKAIEVYSTGGADEYDVHIHDNIIHDAICDGVDFNQVNPDGANTMGGQGSVEAYNNVIYHVGTGPAPNSGDSDYACFEVGSQSTHTNPIQIYNNTLYDCGARGNGDSGMISYSSDGAVKIEIRNNIFNPVGSEPYFTSNSSGAACSNSNATGSNNLWFGAGAPPCGTLFAANVNSDPLFIDPTTARNFRLQSGSPAIDAGTTISTLATDLDGVSRPQGAAYDIGAYEFVTGTVTTRPNPPTSLKLVSVQ